MSKEESQVATAYVGNEFDEVDALRRELAQARSVLSNAKLLMEGWQIEEQRISSALRLYGTEFDGQVKAIRAEMERLLGLELVQ